MYDYGNYCKWIVTKSIDGTAMTQLPWTEGKSVGESSVGLVTDCYLLVLWCERQTAGLWLEPGRRRGGRLGGLGEAPPHTYDGWHSPWHSHYTTDTSQTLPGHILHLSNWSNLSLELGKERVRSLQNWVVLRCVCWLTEWRTDRRYSTASLQRILSLGLWWASYSSPLGMFGSADKLFIGFQYCYVLWICDENTANRILKILDNLETKWNKYLVKTF